jgi:hypothetical protein
MSEPASEKLHVPTVTKTVCFCALTPSRERSSVLPSHPSTLAHTKGTRK